MVVLKRALASSVWIAMTSCYSPELRDCTVLCASVADCAEGQICGSDDLCAQPSLAGRCGRTAIGDASIQAPDAAGVRDAGTSRDAGPDAAPDAAVYGVVTVAIAGKGSVTVEGQGTCDDDDHTTDCLFVVPLDLPVTVSADADNGWRFDEWTMSECADESSTCTFQPTLVNTVSARFRNRD